MKTEKEVTKMVNYDLLSLNHQQIRCLCGLSGILFTSFLVRALRLLAK